MNARRFLLATLSTFVFAAPGVSRAAEGYPLQTRSEFDSSLVERNPFWPIGHVHQQNAPVVRKVARPVDAELSADAFVVTSILIGGGLPLAVINGRDVAEGDTVEAGGVMARVAEIRDGEVILRYQNKEVAAPLRTR